MTTVVQNMSALGRIVRKLRDDTSGIAMTEFALSMPILLSLSFVGIETANYTLANLRASQIALMVADNAGRVRTSIDEADINEVMIGARLAGQNINLGTKGRIILSSLEPNGLAAPNTGQMIRWQRCFGAKNVTSSYGAEGDGTTSASMVSGMGPTGQKIAAMNGAAVMFVELVYDYEPIMPAAFFSPRTIRYTAAYTVRERASNTLSNLTNMSNSQKRLCTNFSAT
ncbi:MAG: TadE/TadG family type IV pilus assembly protein [Chakrabartia godavariana]